MPAWDCLRFRVPAGIEVYLPTALDSAAGGDSPALRLFAIVFDFLLLVFINNPSLTEGELTSIYGLDNDLNGMMKSREDGLIGRSIHHTLRMVARRSFKPSQDEEVTVNRLAKAIEKERRKGADKTASHVRH